MATALRKTTLGACLAAFPVFLPQALTPADARQALVTPPHPAVALPAPRYAAELATRYRVQVAKVAATARPHNQPRKRQRPVPTSATELPQSADVVAGGLGGLTAPPAVAVTAYRAAAARANIAHASCNLSWTLLAAIGQVESHHAASGGSSSPTWNGIADPPVVGPALNGRNGRALPDTDGGRLDGDPRWDHAVGPMQFLPSTWQRFGVDADNDGVANPQDIRDAAAAAGNYLCNGNRDLREPQQLAAAIYSYNNADWYVSEVASLSATYDNTSVTAAGSADVVSAAIAFAYAHLGDPYEWGGTGPLYDCSGFTQAAYAAAGVTIPRTSEEQWLALPHVAEGSLRAGDLVFFNPGEFRAGLPGHVGIYLGNGYMVADPHSDATVSVRPISGAGTYVGAARPALLGPLPAAPVPTGSAPTAPVAAPPPAGDPLPAGKPTPAGKPIPGGTSPTGNSGPGGKPTPIGKPSPPGKSSPAGEPGPGNAAPGPAPVLHNPFREPRNHTGAAPTAAPPRPAPPSFLAPATPGAPPIPAPAAAASHSAKKSGGVAGLRSGLRGGGFGAGAIERLRAGR